MREINTISSNKVNNDNLFRYLIVIFAAFYILCCVLFIINLLFIIMKDSGFLDFIYSLVI